MLYACDVKIMYRPCLHTIPKTIWFSDMNDAETYHGLWLEAEKEDGDCPECED